jgi:hypothetical protein
MCHSGKSAHVIRYFNAILENLNLFLQQIEYKCTYIFYIEVSIQKALPPFQDKSIYFLWPSKDKNSYLISICSMSIPLFGIRRMEMLQVGNEMDTFAIDLKVTITYIDSYIWQH